MQFIYKYDLSLHLNYLICIVIEWKYLYSLKDNTRRISYKPHIYLKRMYRVLFASINSETRQERRTEQEYHTGRNDSEMKGKKRRIKQWRIDDRTVCYSDEKSTGRNIQAEVSILQVFRSTEGIPHYVWILRGKKVILLVTHQFSFPFFSLFFLLFYLRFDVNTSRAFSFLHFLIILSLLLFFVLFFFFFLFVFLKRFHLMEASLSKHYRDIALSISLFFSPSLSFFRRISLAKLITHRSSILINK